MRLEVECVYSDWQLLSFEVFTMSQCERFRPSFEHLESRRMLALADIVDGYTDKWTYVPGETIQLHLNGATVQENVDLVIYAANAKPYQTIQLDSLAPQTPAEEAWRNGFGYEVTAEYTVPNDMDSGIYYFGKPKGVQDGRGGKQIPFIIKRASKQSDIVYLTSTNTANAYNQKGGESVYTRYAVDKNPTVSFERPRNVHFRTRPLNLWMDNQEFDHRVISDFDMDDYSELEGSRLLIVAGHNEYWTEEARDNFDRFIAEGGSVLILSGNFMYRQVEYPTHDSLKILGYWDQDLVMESTAMNYSWGGRGRSCSACDSTIGFSGLKIVDPAAPYFDGVTINRGDIIRIPYNSEFDGFPNLGLNADDATGFPIVDPEYANDFYYFDLLGFDIAQMSWKPQPSRTLGGWIEFQHRPESGRVINLAATDWANFAFGDEDVKALTGKMIEYLLAEQFVPPPLGDFDFNDQLNVDDIDRLTIAVRQQQSPLWKYDLNQDGRLNAIDRDTWMEAKGTSWGDVNLDGRFTSQDLVQVFIAGEYEDNVPGNSTFAEGDWDGDGDFSSSDFILAFRSNAYEKASAVAATSVAPLTAREMPGEYVAAAIMAQSTESQSHRRSALEGESVDLAFQRDDPIKDIKPATVNAPSRPVSFFESIADLKARAVSDSETSSDLQSLESSFQRRSETGI